MNAALPCSEESSLLRGDATLPSPSPVREVGYEELQREAIAARRVVVLAGYSNAGYRHPEVLEEIVAGLVRENGDHTLYVAGATQAGIGAAYAVIRREAAALGLKGVRTAGLVSSLARGQPENLAEMDLLCYVPSPSWEVPLPNGRSANVDILRGNIQPLMVCLGGGPVAAKELSSCLDRGFPARVYAGPAMLSPRTVKGVLHPFTGAVAEEFKQANCQVITPALPARDMEP